MFKRFLKGLFKTIFILVLCLGIIGTAVYFIYDRFAIDRQVLIDEYEVIAQEKPVRTPPPTPVPTPKPTPTPVPTPAPDWPQGLDMNDWKFVIADDADKDYTPPKVVYFDGCRMDQRMVKDTEAMLVAARKAKLLIHLESGYWDAKKATAESNDSCLFEHNTGLALDILATSQVAKNNDVAKSEIGLWLAEHAAEYGFILRYPEGKEDITGHEYCAYHYRYVGKDAAMYIKEKGITLEEFVALYQ
jgi:D-alanyl-D-alanine carboxypeptidase